jgi:hypothetical protein
MPFKGEEWLSGLRVPHPHLPGLGGVESVVPGCPVADTPADRRVRLDVLADLADRVGTCYEPSCLATCGNAKFCRERAFRAGTPNVTGTGALRLLPEITTLNVTGTAPARRT